MHDDVQQTRTKKRHDRRERARVPVVTLGDEVTRGKIEEGTDEDGEHEPDSRFGDGKEKCGSDTENRRRRVSDKPAKGLLPSSPILQYEIHGVDAVRKIMGQHRGGHDDTDGSGGLETDTDCHAVEEAMCRKSEGAEESTWSIYTTVFFMRVEEDKTIENEIAEETECDHKSNC